MMKKTLAILCIVALAATVAVALAAGYLMTAPASAPVTVNPTPAPATMSAVNPSVTTLTVGNNLVLSTTVSDATSGIVVTFFNQNDVSVGTATTNGSGLASLTITPPVGTWIYHATATHP